LRRRIDTRNKRLTKARSLTTLGAIVGTFAAGYAQRSVAAVGVIPGPNDDPIDYYVGDEETYDSNLYRLPSYITDVSTLIAPNATREDYINTAFVGFDGVWTPAQQQIALNVRANDNRFAHNTELNNYSGNADLLWNWRVGSILSGQAGGDYTRSLANFSETLYLGKDEVDSSDVFGSARYQVGPRWAVYSGIRETDSTHSLFQAKYNDYKSSKGNAGIEFATAVEDTIGLEYTYIHGRFDEGVFLVNGLPFNRNFDQNTISGVLKYVLSDKTTINATGSYVRSSYTNEPVGEFSGNTWNVSMQWQATEKTQVIASVYRQLQAYLGSQADYFVGTGGSIEATWAASAKLTFKFVGSYASQNYISTSPSVTTTGAPRKDKINAEQAIVTYDPTRALEFSFSYNNQRRDSNQAQFGFNDELATVTGTFKF
jgi:Putative beta-barrel porin 2